jgi:hypothetical protein
MIGTNFCSGHYAMYEFNDCLKGRYARIFSGLDSEPFPEFKNDIDRNLFVLHFFAGYRFGGV